MRCNDNRGFQQYVDSTEIAKEIITYGRNQPYWSNAHQNTRDVVLADTLFNRHPDTEALIDIARLANSTVKFFNHDL